MRGWKGGGEGVKTRRARPGASEQEGQARDGRRVKGKCDASRLASFTAAQRLQSMRLDLEPHAPPYRDQKKEEF